MHPKALEIRVQIYGGDSHPFLADSYGNLGSLRETRQYEEALEMHMKSREIKTRYGGGSHPGVANKYQNLACLYRSQGNQVQAREIASKAHQIYLNVLGPDHPSTKKLKSFLRVYASQPIQSHTNEENENSLHNVYRVKGEGEIPLSSSRKRSWSRTSQS